MKIGVSIGVFDEASTQMILDRVKEWKLELVELCSGAGSIWPKSTLKNRGKKIKALLDSCGLEAVLHAPDQGIDVASLNPVLRGESVRQIKETIDLAANLEARVVTLHPGARLAGKPFGPMCWKAFLSSLEECCKHAEAKNVLLGLENVPFIHGLCHFAEEFQAVFMKVDSRNLGMTLDLGHANIGHNPIEFIHKLGRKIVNVHVSDNDGTQDKHLPLGKGVIRFDAVLEALMKAGYKDALILEIRGSKECSWRDAVTQSKDYLENLMCHTSKGVKPLQNTRRC